MIKYPTVHLVPIKSNIIVRMFVKDINNKHKDKNNIIHNSS